MMSSPVILIISCQAHRNSRQEAVRGTWARRLPPGQPLFFVEGGHSATGIEGDRIQLTVPDAYDDLAEKCFRALDFVHDNMDYRGVLKCDDDTYVHALRCIDILNTFGDYRGNPPTDQDQFPEYAQGGCYWLSRNAVAQLTCKPFESHSAAPWFKGNSRMRKLGEGVYRETTSIEDVMVGSLLAEAGISLEPDHGFHGQIRPTVYQDVSLLSNHYVNPKWMYRIDRMGDWPQTFFWKQMMRIWTLLPSASKPK